MMCFLKIAVCVTSLNVNFLTRDWIEVDKISENSQHYKVEYADRSCIKEGKITTIVNKKNCTNVKE